MSNRDVTPNSARHRPLERPPDGQSGSTQTDRRQLWRDLWLLINRANVTLQLLVGALLVTLVDLEFMLRVRLGWRLGPPSASWPLWLMLAIPAGVTLLWLALATRASIGAFRQRGQPSKRPSRRPRGES